MTRRSPAKVRCFLSTLGLSLTLTGVPLLTTLHLAVPIAQAQSVPADVRRGYEFLAKGWVDDAIASFRQAVQRHPQSIEGKLGLAIAYRRAGQDANAWQAYQQVLAQDPNNQLALKTLGILGAYRPEWQVPGINALTTFLRLVPNDLEARGQRALLYGYQGRFPESLADYQIVLRQNPTPDMILGAAQIYTYTGNYQQGLDLFNRYRQITGRGISGNPAIAYARAIRELGNPAEAIQVLRSQLPSQLNSTAIQIRSELSQAYLANGQSTEALAVLDPLRGRQDSRLPLARALNELGRQANNASLRLEAAGLYRQALQTTQPTPGLVQEVADVLSGVPQERQYALQLYRQLTQQQPNDPVLGVKQWTLENQLGLISRSELRQRLQTAFQSLPSDPVQQNAIAQALVRVDPVPELLPVYQRLIQANVSEPFLQFRLAQLLIQRNDVSGAQRALAAYRATPQGARDQATELLLAEIDRVQGNLNASGRRYQALIEKNASGSADPDILTAALRGLAGVRVNQQRFGDALNLYDQILARQPQDLPVQLERTTVAYRAKQISVADADAVLRTWFQQRPETDLPPELYDLVGALPAATHRIPLYTTLVDADPDHMPVQVRLVQALTTRNPRQAQAYVSRLLARLRNSSTDVRDRPGVYFLQGQLAQALGNLQQAGDAYQAILALEPDNSEALSALGGIRFQQRQFDAATQLYSEVLTLNPNDQGAQKSLAELMAAQGNSIEALNQFEQIQFRQYATGNTDPEVTLRVRQIQENLLRQRGFQPPWERY